MTRHRPDTRAFRVLDHGRYTEKALRAMLRAHDVGALEILVRGLDVRPDDTAPTAAADRDGVRRPRC